MAIEALRNLVNELATQFIEFRSETTATISRLQRELATQDRMLTELRRERAMMLATTAIVYDPTKPLPGTVADYVHKTTTTGD